MCIVFGKEREQELDYKSSYFMDLSISFSEREGMAELMRRIRNKIAREDFEKVNPLLEEYALKYKDGRVLFDYNEYTRTSWVLLHISCSLEKILIFLMYLMLMDNQKLNIIRNVKET